MSWLDFYQFRTDDLMISTSRLYIISLYVAVVAMFGGVSQLSPCNFGEYVLYALMMLLGSLVWAWVVASLCSILATLNPHSTAFQNTIDELEYFMRERGFSQAHRVRLRDFFRQTQDYSRLASYNNLMIKMSVQLRGDTALKIGMTNLKMVWCVAVSAATEPRSLARCSLGASVIARDRVRPPLSCWLGTAGTSHSTPSRRSSSPWSPSTCTAPCTT